MNLSVKKASWIIELLIIILFVIAINLSVVSIGFKNFLSIISCQIINFIGAFLLFIVAIHRIISESKGNQLSLNSYFQNKLSFSNALIILLLLFLSLCTSALAMQIKAVEIFNYSIFTNKEYFYLHLAHFQTWIVISAIIIVVTLTALAEELYFRCYLFGIQFIQFGKYTWIINGVSWSIYHIFSPQNFLVLLPQCLMYSYVYQKNRNIWITIIAHLISNYVSIYPAIKIYYSFILT